MTLHPITSRMHGVIRSNLWGSGNTHDKHSDGRNFSMVQSIHLSSILFFYLSLRPNSFLKVWFRLTHAHSLLPTTFYYHINLACRGLPFPLHKTFIVWKLCFIVTLTQWQCRILLLSCLCLQLVHCYLKFEVWSLSWDSCASSWSWRVLVYFKVSWVRNQPPLGDFILLLSQVLLAFTLCDH